MLLLPCQPLPYRVRRVLPAAMGMPLLRFFEVCPNCRAGQ